MLKEKKPSYPLTVPNWGWDQGKAGTRAVEIKMGRGRCWTRDACQSTLGREGIDWEVDPHEGMKVQEVNWLFLEGTWPVPHPKLIEIQGNEQTLSLIVCCSGLAPRRCTGLSYAWTM